MRRRALQMTTWAVAVAVLVLGLPGLVVTALLVFNNAQGDLDTRANAVATIIDRRYAANDELSARSLADLTDFQGSSEAQLSLRIPGHADLQVGDIDGAVLTSRADLQSGGYVEVSIPRSPVTQRAATFVGLGLGLILVSFLVGVMIAFRQSRKISAPLIYLAASAEQLGQGQVRPQMKPSGIEEIDLVYQELARTADRMAGRIAAERQFAADAAHQLRTPLTALSMRIEEIEYLTEDDEVREEASKALEQIDRLGGVVEELMATSRSSSGGTTEAIHLDDVFEQQKDEWEEPFKRANRELEFRDEAVAAALATPGALSQIVATLIENSLKYGSGTTTVSASQSGKMVHVKVIDEGKGVPEDVAPVVFNKGVSTGGSTGIGLAVAKELAEVDGGRLELTNRVPAEFTLTLSAVPLSLDPDKILPAGAIISVGARRRRR